jgi:hypothetical protein
MARLTGNFDFKGKLGNISAYKIKGKAETVLRTKGGASRYKIKHHPAFINTRRNNAEFGGAAVAGKALRVAFNPVHHITGTSVGHINKFTRALANMDTVSEWGRRAVRFSQTRQFMEGFNLNKDLAVSSIIRQSLVCQVLRNSGSASLQVPALVNGINLKIPPDYPLFRLVVMLTVISDVERIASADPIYRAVAAVNYPIVCTTTEWFASAQDIPEQHFNLQMPDFTSLPNCQSLLLGIGVEFGLPISTRLIKMIPKQGAAVILATA